MAYRVTMRVDGNPDFSCDVEVPTIQALTDWLWEGHAIKPEATRAMALYPYQVDSDTIVEYEITDLPRAHHEVTA